MSSQLVLYKFTLSSSTDSVSNTLLYMTVFFVLFFSFIEDGIRKHTGKWSDMSLLKMAVLKTSVSERVSENIIYRILSIAVVVFRVTLFGLFVVGIIPFL